VQALRQLKDCQVATYEITTEDGVSLLLHRAIRGDPEEAVFLMHGAASSTEMFTSPEVYNLSTYLHDHGYGDVWMLEWRVGSVYGKRYLSEGHNLDDVALYDIPAAISFLRNHIGKKPLHIIGHCLGAMVVAMSMAARLVESVASLCLANVGLFPKLGPVTDAKLSLMVDLVDKVMGVERFTPNPADMDLRSHDFLLQLGASVCPSTCGNPTCRMLSFMWGAGETSTIFNHDHIHPKTHERLHDYYGPVSLSYLHHMKKMLSYSAAVKMDEDDPKYGALPNNYLDHAANIDVPTLLITGKDNICWYDSIQEYYALIQKYYPQMDVEMVEIPSYCHVDVFMGVNAYFDVFPAILSFLDRHKRGCEMARADRFWSL
jgi:cholesterol oxidase